MSESGFACPSCGAQVVDADPEGDWMCAECGETHFAPHAAPPPRLPPPEGAQVGVEPLPMPPLPPASTYEGRPAGMRRHFGVCLLLGIVSLGIYFLYWQLRVFGEVDRQEGRPRLAWLWWASFGAVSLAVLLTLSSGLDAIRAGRYDPSRGPAAVFPLLLAGQAAYIAYIGAEGWNLRAASRRRGIDGPAIQAVVALLALTGALHLARILFAWPSAVEVLALPLDLFAYAILQGGLNRYWDAVAQARTASAPAPTAEGTG